MTEASLLEKPHRVRKTLNAGEEEVEIVSEMDFEFYISEVSRWGESIAGYC